VRAQVRLCSSFTVDVERADLLDGELDLVAVHEGVEPAMIGPGGQYVAGLQRMDRAQPFDAARNLVGHVGGVELLHELAVVLERDGEVLRIGDLVGG